MNPALHTHGTNFARGRANTGSSSSALAAKCFSSKSRRLSIPEAKPVANWPRKPDRAALSEDVRLAQQGDASAFETIYQLHSPRVYALCLRMLGDPVEAEDLAQEAFIRVFRKIQTFRGESTFSSWLHRLTANLVLMSLRKRKRKAMTTSLDEMPRLDEEHEMPKLEVGGPDLRLAGTFDRLELQTALAELPDGYRLMFTLHDVHGYEYKEIAALRGCSIGNSKSQVHRARKRLRELLGGERGGRAR